MAQYVKYKARYWGVSMRRGDELHLYRLRDTSLGVIAPASECKPAEPEQVAAIDWWRRKEKW